ncbi:MAG: DNA polymerase II large subunit [Thermoplasmata archaeon]
MEDYFNDLKLKVEKCYEIAELARSKGKDPEEHVEIPMAEDLASRVENLIGIEGIAKIIREFSKKYDRETVSIMAAREIAKRFSDNKQRALDISIRVGLAILTEGILVAPLEGITEIKLKKNRDNTEYLSIYYSGPIRGAGGTAQALSVLIGDLVRKDLGIGNFKPTDEIIERYKEEIQIYGNLEHLQYQPTPEEIEITVRNCPVCIDGEGTLESEVSGFRDLPEVETNRVRGGMCLVVAEGIIQKARKLKGIVEKMNIGGWEFLEKLIKEENGENSSEASERYIEDLVAGRPVFSHSEMKGGFRLRYGRCRTGGLATVSINPASMVLMDNFIAIGTQLKLEFPGKAAGITSCDSIEGPIVLLENGDLVQINDYKEAIKLKDKVKKIYDNGEILIPFGEFLENNYPLKRGAFTKDWWLEIAKSKGIENVENENFENYLKLSLKYDIPLHPDYNLFWHDISLDELKKLRNHLIHKGHFENGYLYIEKDATIKEILCSLGALHKERDFYIIEKYGESILFLLGLEYKNGKIIESKKEINDATDTIDFIKKISGISIYPRAPTRVGARMGRPEKAAERKMRPPVNVLFPIGETIGKRRSITLLKENSSEKVQVNVGIRICPKCKTKTYKVKCERCNTRTYYSGKNEVLEIPIIEEFKNAFENLGIEENNFDVKGVKGLISKESLPEPLEKGILRAKHGVWVFKDGTSRFDMSNLAITHFRPNEVGLSIEKAREFGYKSDIYGNELKDPNQILQLLPQDIIISKKGAEYLFNVSKFIDDLLERYYGLEPYYKAKSVEDMIGHLVMGLSPHTSGAILARIIGFTDAQACFAHPFYHAAKRRNCDGDEDSVMLVLDALINFSRHFLPSSRGGLMDAPLFLSIRVDPKEIDKEALNVDIMYKYPLEFYESTIRGAKPAEISSIMEIIKNRLGNENVYSNYGFTNDTENINVGVNESAYKTLGEMQNKTYAQLILAEKLRAVNEIDVANRIVSHHFIPDIMGNMRKYGTQEFRCSKCNRKYRRITLSGKCECGGNIILTISEGGITKYLDMAKEISEKYKISRYTKQRLLFAEEAIRTLFVEEKQKSNGKKLEDFI